MGRFNAYFLNDAKNYADKETIKSNFNVLDSNNIIAGTVLSGYDVSTAEPTFYVSGTSVDHFCYRQRLPRSGKVRIMLSNVTKGIALMILNASNQRLEHYTLSQVKTTTLSYKTAYEDYYELHVAKLIAAQPTAYEIIVEFLTSDSSDAYIQMMVNAASYDFNGETALVTPSKLVALSGREMNLYYDNILKNNSASRILQASAIGFSKQFNDSARMLTGDTTSGAGYISVYLKDVSVIDLKKLITIVKVDANAGLGLTKKCLFIGDSLTYYGSYLTELLALFGADVMDITLLGTRGTAPELHEGRGGWSAYDYVNEPTGVNGELVANPFYNGGTFDFNYYMTQQGYAGVDYVFLCLGTNDVSRTSQADFIASYNTMISSIKAFNANIKIGIWLFPVPSQLEQMQVVKANFLTYNQLLIDEFDKRESENLYLIPVYFNVDPLNDFPTEQVALSSRNSTLVTRVTDTIHPANAGYYKIADVIYSYIKYMASLG